MSELTAKQKAFIEQLPLNQWNGTKAAIAAGYAKNSAAVMAHRLQKNPKIVAELEKLTVEIAEKADVEVGEIIAALRGFAFGGKKATNGEQLKALDMLGRYKMMWTERHIIETGERQRELDEHEKREAQLLSAARLRLPGPTYDEAHHIEGDVIGNGARIAPMIEGETVETAGKQEGNNPDSNE